MIGKEDFSMRSFCVQIAMVLAYIQENLRGRCQNIDYADLITQACNMYVGQLENSVSVIWNSKMKSSNHDLVREHVRRVVGYGIKDEMLCLVEHGGDGIAFTIGGIHIYDDGKFEKSTIIYIPWETIISAVISVKADNQIMINDIAFSIPPVFPARIIGNIMTFVKNHCQK